MPTNKPRIFVTLDFDVYERLANEAHRLGVKPGKLTWAIVTGHVNGTPDAATVEAITASATRPRPR